MASHVTAQKHVEDLERQEVECIRCSRRKLCTYVPLALLALLALFLLLGLIGAMLEPTEQERELARQWALDLEARSIELERERDKARWVFRENPRMAGELRRALKDPEGEHECDLCYE